MGTVVNNEKAKKSSSYYVLRVYFHDGNERSLNSRDRKKKTSKHKDENIGKKRLVDQAMKWKNKARTILIYDRRTDKLIFKMVNGYITLDHT